MVETITREEWMKSYKDGTLQEIGLHSKCEDCETELNAYGFCPKCDHKEEEGAEPERFSKAINEGLAAFWEVLNDKGYFSPKPGMVQLSDHTYKGKGKYKDLFYFQFTVGMKGPTGAIL